jgi:hypothetical protein
MAVDLVDFDTIKNALQLKQSSVSDYPNLSELLGLLQASFEDYTGRLFENTSRTESVILGLRATRMIPLRGLPISSVSSVTVDGDETDDYTITNWGIRLGSPINEATVEAVYTGGLIDASPADNTEIALKRAALLQIAYEFNKSPNFAAEVVTTDGGNVTTPEIGLLKEVKRLLKGYVHYTKAPI